MAMVNNYIVRFRLVGRAYPRYVWDSITVRSTTQQAAQERAECILLGMGLKVMIIGRYNDKFTYLPDDSWRGDTRQVNRVSS